MNVRKPERISAYFIQNIPHTGNHKPVLQSQFKPISNGIPALL
jgi:hypothetical protein